MKRQPFTWQGIEHWTLRDLLETVSLISDEDEAEDFLSAYAEVCDDEAHARRNMGYLAEILDRHDHDEAKRICDLFDVTPTLAPEQVFKGSSLGVKVLD